MKEFAVKDSGERQEFESGMVRDTQDGKARPDLISPFVLMRLGEHMRKGAVKYSEHNWTKGQPFSRSIASTFRHLMQWMMGYRDEDHLAAIMFGCMTIMHYEEMIEMGVLPKELDDMQKYEPKETV